MKNELEYLMFTILFLAIFNYNYTQGKGAVNK